jgi:hypothetical protein
MILSFDPNCALCGRPKWYHILPATLRREQDRTDDGHPFRQREIIAGDQMRLPFRADAQPNARSKSRKSA